MLPDVVLGWDIIPDDILSDDDVVPRFSPLPMFPGSSPMNRGW